MSETVHICYVDLAGNHHRYDLPDPERRVRCLAVRSESFDDNAFKSWCADATIQDGLYPANGERLNPQVIARMWYEVEEVR